MLLPHTSFGETFWGWQEKQLPDATLILTSPAGRTYVTTPGSALLFPSLCQGVGAIAAAEADVAPDYCGDRTAMMPTRRRTRAQDRAGRIAVERRRNSDARGSWRAESVSMGSGWSSGAGPPGADDPPPF